MCLMLVQSWEWKSFSYEPYKENFRGCYLSWGISLEEVFDTE